MPVKYAEPDPESQSAAGKGKDGGLDDYFNLSLPLSLVRESTDNNTHSAPNILMHAKIERICCSDDITTIWCASTAIRHIHDTLMACG